MLNKLFLIVTMLFIWHSPNAIRAAEIANNSDSLRTNAVQHDTIAGHQSHVRNAFGILDAQGLKRSWITSVETLWPRDIDEKYAWYYSCVDATLHCVSIAHSWQWRSGFELQLGLTFVDAAERYKSVYYFSPSGQSEAFAVSVGPTLCWTVMECWRLGVFADISPHLMLSYREFPRDGTWANLFGRNSLGLSCAINSRYSVEFAQRWGHVSNGGTTQNPGWDGEGIVITIRRQHSIR
ncbi:MAG: hypothetical protein ACOZB3_00945 [Calditrichota bacterium]